MASWGALSQSSRLILESLSSVQRQALDFLGSKPVYSIRQVCNGEKEFINQRRSQHHRDPITSHTAFGPASGSGATEHEPVEDTVGLALSGGGIRSAAFSLGALQALHVLGAIPNIDYLSTVSGGGYIGCSMTAGLSKGEGRFPFPSEIRRDESPTLQHIRDYSNYLIPHGKKDVILSIVIYLRGLAASALSVAPWLVLAVSVTFLFNPDREHLSKSRVWGAAGWILPEKTFGSISAVLDSFSRYFALPIAFAAVFCLGLLGWALLRSSLSSAKPEVPGKLPTNFALALLALAFLLFAALQSLLLNTMFIAAEQSGKEGEIGVAQFESWVKYLVVVLTPLALGIGMFGNKLQWLIKTTTETSSVRRKLMSLFSRVAVYMAAAVIPAVIWVVYLELSYWVIANASTGEEWWLRTAANWAYDMSDSLRVFGKFLIPVSAPVPPPGSMAIFYFLLIVTVFLGMLSMRLNVNANSLHRLYRDRLSKAFLVQPLERLQSPDQEIPAIERFRLAEINTEIAPYHLVNAALNLQASRTANRRGRNADFFLFSKAFVGSEATGYVETGLMERRSPQVDLATAMAISGAAASSNMGSASIRSWTLSLALLNVRLGYWLRNPKRIADRFINRTDFTPYFLYETLGRLNEDRDYVYVTDGGHVENLGVYELLRRRCCLIVVIDGEADPDLHFSSLVRLERYARIDLGIRIELPLEEIRAAARTVSKTIERRGDPGSLCSKGGPHCAIGKIYYPGGEGRLVYVKASLTGDESNYVIDYKRRYSSFPHQTTGDQFFTEEQFEVYRALGFHEVYGLLERDDRVAVVRAPADPSPNSKKPPFPGRDPIETAAVNQIKGILLGRPAPAPAAPAQPVPVGT